jgi:hypothetical protein
MANADAFQILQPRRDLVDQQSADLSLPIVERERPQPSESLVNLQR